MARSAAPVYQTSAWGRHGSKGEPRTWRSIAWLMSLTISLVAASTAGGVGRAAGATDRQLGAFGTGVQPAGVVRLPNGTFHPVGRELSGSGRIAQGNGEPRA